MSRPKKTVRTVFKHIGIPEDLAGKMEVHLFSAVEGKIPLGAQQEFFTSLLRGYFGEADAGAKLNKSTGDLLRTSQALLKMGARK